MPKYSDCPAKHIISFRVSEQERNFLNDLARQKGLNLSNYMRHILAQLERNSGRTDLL